MRCKIQELFKQCGAEGEVSSLNYLLFIGLLASVSTIYILNLRFYSSVSSITWEMKDITNLLKSIDLKSFGRVIGRNFPTKAPCRWPPEHLNGREPLNRTEYDLETLNRVYPFIEGGHFAPFNCIPNKKVAIIVPYRDREPQLKIFLNNVIPRICRQKQEFGIYIVEQTTGAPFNRGMLANIGYKEAMSELNYDCIVIHDLDILPEDDRNYYTCANNPIHMAVKVEQFAYKLPYDVFAGGVTSFTSEQFKTINGFSNQFFGWGGEDDDLYSRIRNKNMSLTRPFEQHGHCGSVKHKQANKKNNRFDILRTSYRLYDKDGLNNLDYTLIKKSQKKLYSWIYAHIDVNTVKEGIKRIMLKSRKR